jgi:[protein-PII] uridylyltransferase
MPRQPVSRPPVASADALMRELRAQLRIQQDKLRERFEARPHPGRLLRGRARVVDHFLRKLWKTLVPSDDLSLVAVGGYGRGELYPASDIDLLVLLPGTVPATVATQVERFIGTLWDIGLDVGHAVRTAEECIEEAAADITVQTTLLEARHLAGDKALFQHMEQALRHALDAQAFFKAKRLEQQERHSRYNETPYSLEPNCKESPGGLRDLQVIQWVARATGLGDRWHDLETHDLVTHAEALQLAAVERRLQELRIRLHHLAQRREDRLVFDYQERLAQSFGIERSDTKRASEILMQRYYRNAKQVTQLNTIVLQNIGQHIFPTQDDAPEPINARFRRCRDLLDVSDEAVFDRQPAAILESFLLMQQHAELKGMTARTLRALWRARTRIDAAFRQRPEHRALFLQLLQQPRGLVHEFRRMNEYSILGRYLPAFARIVGQMQHDLFHVYTVDQHILQVLRNVRRFTMDEHAHEYPLMSRLIAGFERHWLIYIAALFHDIAKGRGGDHSTLGMRDARKFSMDHGLDDEDTALVVFLVEHHLTMSQVAQKQDLSDPDVIRVFAGIVGTPRRLTALYLLTHADIRGTSPKVWNNWKAKLLEDLFVAAMRLLRGDTPQQALGIAERQEQARATLRYFGLREGVENAFWSELDTVYFLRHDPDDVAWHTRQLYHRPASDAPVVKARPNQIGEGLQVMVYTHDQRDLFARLCGFFSRLGYNIVDARIHTTRHGYALDSFILLDPNQTFNAREMVSLVEHDLTERLTTQAPPDQPVNGRLSRQLKHFPVQPEIVLRPDERGQHWIMQVTAADRPGLLFAVAQILARHGIDLHTAKIATLGERVEDVFLISGSELAQTATLLQLERELLEALSI